MYNEFHTWCSRVTNILFKQSQLFIIWKLIEVYRCVRMSELQVDALLNSSYKINVTDDLKNKPRINFYHSAWIQLTSAQYMWNNLWQIISRARTALHCRELTCPRLGSAASAIRSTPCLSISVSHTCAQAHLIDNRRRLHWSAKKFFSLFPAKMKGDLYRHDVAESKYGNRNSLSSTTLKGGRFKDNNYVSN